MSKKLMIADDEDMVLTLVSATLGRDPRYTLILARDGESALDMARRERPDLLLLDVLMPKKNGYQVCKALKEDPSTSTIMVIMLTSLAQQADREKALEAGADDFFTKPFSPTALVRKVDEVFEQT